MLGRGIDQILTFPEKPGLHEAWVKDARTYVKLAEKTNGKITYPVEPNYIWGDSLKILDQMGPDLRLINLETAVTTSEDFWPEKPVHYRIHPKNISVLKDLKVSCCNLANNHTLDWGWEGFKETLGSLEKLNVPTTGAGRNEDEAKKPVVIELGNEKRVLIWGIGCCDSGIPADWAAKQNQLGIYWLPKVDRAEANQVIQLIQQHKKKEGDLVVISIHWGGNWGYEIPQNQREFAHCLIEEGGVSIIHGHSSHHVKGFELYQGKLILYGCGDFLTDYEGISGFEDYHGNIALMYFPKIDLKDGTLLQLTLAPLKVKNFQLKRATQAEQEWIKKKLLSECSKLKTTFENSFLIKWVGT